jgi:hypothetical protein
MLLLSLQHVIPHWYKEMPLTKVFKYISKVKELTKQPKAQLDFHRVYIPKGDELIKGKCRPLGVPAIE